MNLLPYERTAIRLLAGESWNSRPIDIIEGDSEPTIVGRDAYWTTPSGKTIIQHPGAYRWPKVYHGSTKRIVVGRIFVEKLVAELRETTLRKQTKHRTEILRLIFGKHV